MCNKDGARQGDNTRCARPVAALTRAMRSQMWPLSSVGSVSSNDLCTAYCRLRTGRTQQRPSEDGRHRSTIRSATLREPRASPIRHLAAPRDVASGRPRPATEFSRPSVCCTAAVESAGGHFSRDVGRCSMSLEIIQRIATPPFCPANTALRAGSSLSRLNWAARVFVLRAGAAGQSLSEL